MPDLPFRHEEPNTSPGFVLWRLSSRWQRGIRDGLAPHDLTQLQFVLLATAAWLTEHRGPPSQSDVAEMSGADTNTVSDTLRRMQAKGLVQRRQDREDGRARCIVLTSEGRQVLARTAPVVEAIDAAFFADPDTKLRLAALQAPPLTTPRERPERSGA